MTTLAPVDRLPDRIEALLPRGIGHQFVLYGDACSGIPGAPHEQTFAAVNAVVRRLAPQPEFIVFVGDEIAGLTPDPEHLRLQWRHWLENEMRWLDRRTIPLWHTTSNHTTYDRMSEAVFRDVLNLPRNGPAGQEGLSYWVRRGNLLMVFVHTSWTELGGEGYVETIWLREVLHAHRDARHKLVVGHHPVFPVNGFSGPYQREIGPEAARTFWDTLVEGGVLAYLCGHILAFDAQVHRGVLQICTAGAGTAHRMPEGIEYLHCIQVVLDDKGLRYQVIDAEGRVREGLTWPLKHPAVGQWLALPSGGSQMPFACPPAPGWSLGLHFTGQSAPAATCGAQTLIATHRPGEIAALWVGLRGPEQRLTVILSPEPRRSPHYWHGPSVQPGKAFDMRLRIHPELGPGGIMFSPGDGQGWSSLVAASPWGPERLHLPDRWIVGHEQGGPDDRPFGGEQLSVSATFIPS